MIPTLPLQPAPPIQVNFLPVFEDAALALGHQDMNEIEQIKPVKIEFVREEPFREVVTRQADNLPLGDQNLSGHNLVPRDTRPTALTLAIKFADSPDIEFLEVRQPNILKYKPSRHTSLILKWLLQSPLNGARNVSHLVIIGLLATAFAAAPAFDDNDGDEDDYACDGERSHLRMRVPAPRTPPCVIVHILYSRAVLN